MPSGSRDPSAGRRPRVQLDHLWLTDFRSWTTAELVLGEGLTVVQWSRRQLLSACAWAPQ